MKINGKTVVVLAEHHYQDLELHYPRLRLLEEGAKVIVAGTGGSDAYTGKYGYPVKVDTDVSALTAAQVDGLVIPGGWAPDRLRLSPHVLKLVRDIMEQGKPLACICHGGWVLASAGVLKGRKTTGYVAIRDDLVNAGAEYVDRDVVVDGNLITSRTPEDLPVFMQAFIRALSSPE